MKLWQMSLMIGLAVMPVLSSAADADISCFGTEPFWSLTMAGTRMAFKVNDEMPVTMSKPVPYSAENTQIDHLKIYATKADDKSAILLIQKKKCSDGMSDNVYPYQSIFMLGNKAYKGCCGKKMKKDDMMSGCCSKMMNKNKDKKAAE